MTEYDKLSSTSLAAKSILRSQSQSSLSSIDAPEVRTRSSSSTSSTLISLSSQESVISQSSVSSSGLKSISPQVTSHNRNENNKSGSSSSAIQSSEEIIYSIAQASSSGAAQSSNSGDFNENSERSSSLVSQAGAISATSSGSSQAPIISSNVIAINSISVNQMSAAPSSELPTVSPSETYESQIVDQSAASSNGMRGHQFSSGIIGNTNGINTVVTRTRTSRSLDNNPSLANIETPTTTGFSEQNPIPGDTESSSTDNGQHTVDDIAFSSEGTSTFRINTQTTEDTSRQITTTLSGTVVGSTLPAVLQQAGASSEGLLNDQPNSENSNTDAISVKTSLAGEARTRSSSMTYITTQNPSPTGSLDANTSFPEASSRSMDAEAHTRAPSGDPDFPEYEGSGVTLRMNKLLSATIFVIYAFV